MRLGARHCAVLVDVIFGVAAAIAAIARVTPLQPGDLIVMDTSSAVAVRFTPRRCLQDSDRFVCESDGIGRLDSTVRLARRSNDLTRQATTGKEG